MTSLSSDRSFNAKWMKLRRQHCLLAENSNTKILITVDSIMACLSSHSNACEKFFVPFNRLCFRIRRDRIESFFWRSNKFLSLSTVKHVVILCETNLWTVSPYEIMDGVIGTASTLEKNCNNLELLFAVYFKEMNLQSLTKFLRLTLVFM